MITGTYKRKAAVVACAAALMLGVVPIAAPAYVAAETPIVSIGGSATELSAPFVKPLWSQSIDNWDASGQAVRSNNVIAEDGRIFAFANNHQLTSIDAATGKRLWTFQKGWKPIMAYSSGNVYGVTGDGWLASIKASGKMNWSSDTKVKDADSIIPLGNAVYVTAGMKLYAFDAATGKLRWQIEEKGAEYSFGFGALHLVDGVVLRSYIVQGALSAPQLNAYDAQTGKPLWKEFRMQEPLKVSGGLIYVPINPYPMWPDEIENGKYKQALTIQAVNVRTGEVKGTRTYGWETPVDPSGVFSYGGSALLDGDNLYVFQGQQLALYDFSKYVPNAKPVKTWAQNTKDLYALHRIHDGRMLYRSIYSGGLSAMKLANGQFIGWQTDNPAMQIDIFGKGVYIGQSDGVFHAYDYASTKPLFSVRTDSRYFGATQKTGGILLVQTKGKLQAVKLPASLK